MNSSGDLALSHPRRLLDVVSASSSIRRPPRPPRPREVDVEARRGRALALRRRRPGRRRPGLRAAWRRGGLRRAAAGLAAAAIGLRPRLAARASAWPGRGGLGRSGRSPFPVGVDGHGVAVVDARGPIGRRAASGRRPATTRCRRCWPRRASRPCRPDGGPPPPAAALDRDGEGQRADLEQVAAS